MRVGAIILCASSLLVGAIVLACNTQTSITDGFSDPSVAIPPSSGVGSASGEVPPSLPRQPGDDCPVELPVDGEPCSGVSGSCRYGADLRDSCRILAVCIQGRWDVTEKLPASCGAPCPLTRSAITPGTVCDDANMTCSFDEGTCACEGATLDGGADAGDGGKSDGGFTKGTWACAPPPSNTTCPLTVPRSTTSCVKPVTCDYGSCLLDRALTYECTGQVWMQTSKSCP